MVEFRVETNSTLTVINKFKDQVSDLRPPLLQIAREFYRSNRFIFKLQGPGKYTDFVGEKIANTWRDPGRPDIRTRNGNFTPYQWAKVKKAWPGVNSRGYPLLRASGRLERSITQDGSPDAIKILTKQSLIIGTSVEYGIHHQFGAPKANVPMRKFLFIDASTTESTDPNLSRRSVAWTKALETYIERIIPRA
jgi:phage gpG-like protein